MTQDYLDLAVLESRYWTKGNDSVKPAFDLLANVHQGNPNSYHYEMFNDKTSLQEVLPRIAASSRIHHVYVASHGWRKGIVGSDGGTISITVISNLLEKISERKLYGIYFGSCLFGDQTVRLLEATNLTWLAGYTTSVDWMSSVLLDLFFWDAYYWSNIVQAENKSKRADSMLEFLFTLFRRVPHLFEEMGLRVSVKYKRSIVTFPDDVFQDGCWESTKEFRKLDQRAEDAIYKNIRKEKPFWWRKS